MKLTQSRLVCLVLALALRVGMLAWGAYQDARDGLPYTDVDHAVFVRGATALLYACPVHTVTHNVEPKEEYEDLQNPPELPNVCAQGVLPAASRFILQAERDLLDPEFCPFEEGSFALRSLHFSLNLFRRPARFLGGMGDPYADPTYRYTPLLAGLLAVPLALLPANVARWAPRAIFVLADLACAVLMWGILDLIARRRTRALARQKRSAPNTPAWKTEQAALEAAAARHATLGWVPVLWLFNVFVAQISTRGSSESVLGVVVLGFVSTTLHSTPGTSAFDTLPAPAPSREVLETIREASSSREQLAEKVDKAAPAHTYFEDEDEEDNDEANIWRETPLAAPLMLALATHVKIYPAIYAIPTLAHLLSASTAAERRAGRSSGTTRGRWGSVLRFAGVAAYGFAGLTGLCYAIWGTPYLRSSYLHHLTRLDVKHNFSPSFLPAYLSSIVPSSGVAAPSVVLGRAASSFVGFVPQLALVAVLGWMLGGRDFIMACAAQTVAFVAWNKVVTSQYFMWFMWFLPLLEPKLVFSSTLEPWVLFALWSGAQAVWLSQAYLLEFEALDTFVRTWSVGLLLLGVHAVVLATCGRAWGRARKLQLARS